MSSKDTEDEGLSVWRLESEAQKSRSAIIDSG